MQSPGDDKYVSSCIDNTTKMSYDVRGADTMPEKMAVRNTGPERHPGFYAQRRDRWFAARARAWERHGVHLGAAWCAVSLDAPRSSALLRRIRGRSCGSLLLAVEGDLLTYRFPHRHRERAKRGGRNPAFLDPHETGRRLEEMLALAGGAAGAVILRLQRIPPNEGLRWEQLVELLEPWLDRLPPYRRYLLECPGPAFLVPGYLDCLRRRGVGHLLRHDGRGSLLDAAQVPGILTGNTAVIRKGNEEDAVWPDCQGGTEEWMLGVLATVRQCVERRMPVYVSVPPPECRLLGETAALMDADLAKLSPFRRRRAA
jgi:hypothetical protein